MLPGRRTFSPANQSQLHPGWFGTGIEESSSCICRGLQNPFIAIYKALQVCRLATGSCNPEAAGGQHPATAGRPQPPNWGTRGSPRCTPVRSCHQPSSTLGFNHHCDPPPGPSSAKTIPDQRSYPQRTKLQQNPTSLWQAPAAKPTPTQQRPLPAIPTEASCPNSQQFSFRRTGKHQTLAPICYIRASAPSSAVAARGGGRGLHTNRTAQLPRELTHSPGFMASYPTTCCAEGKTDRSVNEATSQQRSDAPCSHTSSGFMQDRAGRWVTSSSGRLHQLHGFTSEAHTTWLVAARTTRRSPTPSSPPAAQRSPLGLRALLLSPHPSTGVGGGGWGGFCFPQSAPHPQSSPHRDAVRSVLAGQDEGEAALFPPPPRSSHPSSAARLKKKSSFKHRTQHSPPPPNQRFPTPAGKAKPLQRAHVLQAPPQRAGGAHPGPIEPHRAPHGASGRGAAPGLHGGRTGGPAAPSAPPPRSPHRPRPAARCPLPAAGTARPGLPRPNAARSRSGRTAATGRPRRPLPRRALSAGPRSRCPAACPWRRPRPGSPHAASRLPSPLQPATPLRHRRKLRARPCAPHHATGARALPEYQLRSGARRKRSRWEDGGATALA